MPANERGPQTHKNNGLINVALVPAEIFSHEAHLRCGMKPMPGRGVTCGFEPENTDTKPSTSLFRCVKSRDRFLGVCRVNLIHM